MPDGDGPIEEFEEAFARIEAAVRGGNTDLSGLGFWKLVRRIKADPELAARFADVAGRIDRSAFEQRVRPRVPVWVGNLVLVAGTAVAATALRYATTCDNRTVSGLLLVAAGAALSVTLHDPAHWIVGRAVGIHFVSYFLDGPTRVQPGLKSDYSTYLRATATARAAMHASGAIASKIAPLIALACAPAADAPWWAVAALIAIALVQVATDVLFSVKHGDWKKVRRELRYTPDR